MTLEGLCSVEECGKSIHAKGLCRRHYNQRHKPKTIRSCENEGCERPVYARDRCKKHYLRLLRGTKVCEVRFCDSVVLIDGPLCSRHVRMKSRKKREEDPTIKLLIDWCTCYLIAEEERAKVEMERLAPRAMFYEDTKHSEHHNWIR